MDSNLSHISGGGESDGGEEVSGGLVVAGRNPAKVFELVEEAFDEIAFAIERGVDDALDFAVRAGRNLGLAAAALHQFDDRPRVVAAVGDERAAGREAFDNRGRQVLSEACPGDRTKRTGRPCSSTAALILALSPPRELPMASSGSPFFRRRRAGGRG